MIEWKVKGVLFDCCACRYPLTIKVKIFCHWKLALALGIPLDPLR
jgi:hypothetical protein